MKKLSALIAISFTSIITVVLFQNCSQTGELSLVGSNLMTPSVT